MRNTVLKSAAFVMALAVPMIGHANSPAPVKIAVFDVEVVDFSAAGPSAKSPTEQAGVEQSTQEIRTLLEQSGRYALIDAKTSEDATSTEHPLRNCNGCEAAIASKLGAEQSLLALITRISKTEYEVDIQIRDTQSGEVKTFLRSGLRMGADYSWSRGVSRLIKDSLLKQD
jgi:hypothetical protein